MKQDLIHPLAVLAQGRGKETNIFVFNNFINVGLYPPGGSLGLMGQAAEQALKRTKNIQ